MLAFILSKVGYISRTKADLGRDWNYYQISQ